jgi:hypothetical protein
LSVKLSVIVVIELKHYTFLTITENEVTDFEMNVLNCFDLGPFGDPPAPPLKCAF